MTSQREIIGLRVTLDSNGTFDIQPEIIRPFDPMGVSLPIELAAIRLRLPVEEISRAVDCGFIPTKMDSSGYRVAVLRDVVEGVRRLRIGGVR